MPPAASPTSGTGDKRANLPEKTYQQIQATGRGSIHMMNKTTGKRNVHAFWNDKLLSTRDGDLDLLILIGSASFVDEEHEQSLKAETLKVWLLAEDKKPEKAAPRGLAPHAKPQAATQSATPTQSRRPHRVEARRNVLAHSPDLNIHDAARLVVHFIDVPRDRMPPPSSTKDKPGAAPLNNKGVALPRSASASRPPAAGLAGPPLATGRKPIAENQKPKAENQPIDLSARSIEAKVLRCEERMALDHLWAEGGALDNVDKRGGVIVRQEAKPGEEGVYIEGNTLDMNCTAGGTPTLCRRTLSCSFWILSRLCAKSHTGQKSMSRYTSRRHLCQLRHLVHFHIRQSPPLARKGRVADGRFLLLDDQRGTCQVWFIGDELIEKLILALQTTPESCASGARLPARCIRKPSEVCNLP